MPRVPLGTTWGSLRGDVEGALQPGGPPSVMSDVMPRVPLGTTWGSLRGAIFGRYSSEVAVPAKGLRVNRTPPSAFR